MRHDRICRRRRRRSHPLSRIAVSVRHRSHQRSADVTPPDHHHTTVPAGHASAQRSTPSHRTLSISD